MDWVREQVPDVPTLLAKLRERPGMWIGTKSIALLNQMLGGIGLAEDWHRIPAEARFGGFVRRAHLGRVVEARACVSGRTRVHRSRPAAPGLQLATGRMTSRWNGPVRRNGFGML